MTGHPQTNAPSAGAGGSPSTPPVRTGLTIALIVALAASVLFYRSLGPFSKTYGVMAPTVLLSVSAILFLITFGGPRRRTLAAALACLAAIISSCESLILTIWAGPSAIDASPLDQTESLFILLTANLAVMSIAILYAKGNRIMLLLYVVIGLVGGGTLLRLVYK